MGAPYIFFDFLNIFTARNGKDGRFLVHDPREAFCKNLHTDPLIHSLFFSFSFPFLHYIHIILSLSVHLSVKSVVKSIHVSMYIQVSINSTLLFFYISLWSSIHLTIYPFLFLGIKCC